MFWRVLALNALVFTAGGLALALSPFTVSSPITLGEAATLIAGIAAMLVVNLALMRRLFAPLTRLASTMRDVDPLKPGQRVQLQRHDHELAALGASFNEMLDRLENERRASARREAQATDAEQRRIASELHDEIGQRLTVLLLTLANAQADADPRTAQRLEAARGLAREALDEMRGVVVQLRPAALDQLGVANALTALARTVEQQTGTEITSRLEKLNGSLSAIESLVIYRVAQEAMTNAVRHAPGSTIQLELAQGARFVRLRVGDHGPGIGNGEVRAPGTGLRSMAERALLVGGSLDIDSSALGTTVTLTVPQAGP